MRGGGSSSRLDFIMASLVTLWSISTVNRHMPISKKLKKNKKIRGPRDCQGFFLCLSSSLCWWTSVSSPSFVVGLLLYLIRWCICSHLCLCARTVLGEHWHWAQLILQRLKCRYLLSLPSLRNLFLQQVSHELGELSQVGVRLAYVSAWPSQAITATRRHFLVWGVRWLFPRCRDLSLSLAWNDLYRVCCKDALLVRYHSGFLLFSECCFQSVIVFLWGFPRWEGRRQCCRGFLSGCRSFPVEDIRSWVDPERESSETEAPVQREKCWEFLWTLVQL